MCAVENTYILRIMDTVPIHHPASRSFDIFIYSVTDPVPVRQNASEQCRKAGDSPGVLESVLCVGWRTHHTSDILIYRSRCRDIDDCHVNTCYVVYLPAPCTLQSVDTSSRHSSLMTQISLFADTWREAVGVKVILVIERMQNAHLRHFADRLPIDVRGRGFSFARGCCACDSEAYKTVRSQGGWNWDANQAWDESCERVTMQDQCTERRGEIRVWWSGCEWYEEQIT